MKILFVQPGGVTAYISSTERQGLQISRGLSQRGHQIVWRAILTGRSGAEDKITLICAAREAGFDAAGIYFLHHRYNLPASIKALKKAIKDIRPDLVCASGYKAGIITAFTPQKPTIEVLHGWTGHTLPVRVYEFLNKLLLRKHDLIIAVSPTQREIALRYGVPPDKVWWIPNALDITRLAPAISGEEWRSNLGLTPNVILIGAVGRLSKEKGYDYLLHAVSILHGDMPNVRLLIAGEGVERAKLERLARELGLQHVVCFLGEIPNGAQLISGLSLLVLSSLSEGIPNVILEAFAYKTPVVATAVGGVPELVKDGETGWLVPPRAPRALAQAIREALSNREEARRRAENAYRHLLENFTVEKQADLWEQALQAAMENWQKKHKRRFSAG
ncbi:MAG: glycosyltransferase [Candidatus Caldarchaeum sp.]